MLGKWEAYIPTVMCGSPSQLLFSLQGSSTAKKTAESQYYDEIYFDSSESSENEDDEERMESASARGSKAQGSHGAGKRKFKKLTNDELFYDPNMDDEDEKWVRRQRMAYHNGEEWAMDNSVYIHLSQEVAYL